jgi:hypothetical protein
MQHARSTGLLRLTAFVALGSFVLHQARYAVGHGGHAGEALARDGHAHMGLALAISLLIAVVVPVVTLLLAASARPRQAGSGTGSARLGALRCATVLLAAFWVQELGEGALSAAHPGGLDAILGQGGPIVLPLALVLGYLVSFLQGSLEAAEDRVAGSMGRRRLAEGSAPERQYVGPERPPLAGLGLVFGFACRPPPSLITSI